MRVYRSAAGHRKRPTRDRSRRRNKARSSTDKRFIVPVLAPPILVFQDYVETWL